MHGCRTCRRCIEDAAVDDRAGRDRDYSFDSLHLIVVFPGGLQNGANAGLVASGTVTEINYSVSGQAGEQTERPFAFTFSLRQTTSGRWLITDTLDSPT